MHFRHAALTLIELLVVIAIVGLLVAPLLAVPVGGGTQCGKVSGGWWFTYRGVVLV